MTWKLKWKYWPIFFIKWFHWFITFRQLQIQLIITKAYILLFLWINIYTLACQKSRDMCLVLYTTSSCSGKCSINSTSSWKSFGEMLWYANLIIALSSLIFKNVWLVSCQTKVVNISFVRIIHNSLKTNSRQLQTHDMVHYSARITNYCFMGPWMDTNDHKAKCSGHWLMIGSAKTADLNPCAIYQLTLCFVDKWLHRLYHTYTMGNKNNCLKQLEPWLIKPCHMFAVL